jgi:cytosine/adenosine deaminase-related metal-dependent hydrolase
MQATLPFPADSKRIVLRNGLLVTLDGKPGTRKADLLVVDGKIAQVSSHIDAGNCVEIDATDFIVLPGFVECHRHLWQTPLRHTGADWDLPHMFVELFIKFGPRMRPDDVYAATLFGRLAALDAGITTLLDWAHIQNTPDHSDAAVSALREASGRSIFGHGQPGDNPKPWMSNSSLPHPEDIRRVRKNLLPSDDSLVTMAMAARGPEFCTMETVEHDVRLARELGLRVTMHMGMGENGAKNRAIEKLQRHKLLGPDITCLHCCTSGDDELKMLAEAGATASVSALMATWAAGFGLPATGRMMAQGLRPSLSTDSEMTASGDMFTEMRAALGAERLVCNNHIENGPSRPALTPADVLSFATVEGARAVGMNATIGSLTPGKRADLIMVRQDALNLAPVIDPIGALVIGGHCGNVEAVIVEGRFVKWAGKLVHADTVRARKLLEESISYLYGSAADFARAQKRS